MKIQEACEAFKEFQWRIGIQLGEVLFENEDVFGDGVNIASRIQCIAEPESIYTFMDHWEKEVAYYKKE